LVLPVPIHQGQARGNGFALSAITSLVRGSKKRPIKKQRDWWGLSLRWPLVNNDEQQSTSSWRPRWDGCQSGGALGLERMGNTVPSFGVTIQTMKKKNMKYTVAFE
jgi:hypothetical protein